MSELDVLHRNKSKYGEIENDFLNTYEYTPTVSFNTNKDLPIANVKKEINELIFFTGSINEAIKNFTENNFNCHVLNFANSIYVGGGIEEGAKAQEEELCRTSPMLYNSLQMFSNGTKTIHPATGKKRYNYVDWGKWDTKILYSPRVIFRNEDGRNSTKYELLKTPYFASVITAAAPDMRRKDFSTSEGESIERMIKHIYYCPINARDDIRFNRPYGTWKPDIKGSGLFKSNSVLLSLFPYSKNILILGPWGCGVFINKWSKEVQNEYRRFMAEAFCSVLSKVKKHYDYVCFAFLENDEINRPIFDEVCRKYFTITEV
jgi:uncharacterized protein (TIGR02452 family)